jgi:hypothetical protein
MRNKALCTACIAASSLSSAATLLLNAYAGAALAALSSIALFALVRGSGSGTGRLDRDAMQMAGNLIDNYSDSADTLMILRRSLSPGFAFCAEMNRAISAYAMQGDARVSFSKLLSSNSSTLREISSAVVQRLDSGAEMLAPLKDIKRRASQENEYRMKSLGSSLNANSVVMLGSVLFFPAFAGIGMQISSFAGASQGFAAVKAGALAAVFVFYIIQSNLANSKYQRGDPVRYEKFALFSAIGILVFKTSSMLSVLAL